MSERTYQTEAIIIKKTRLGEADRILTLYTAELGKIQGFAKSVSKTKSKLAGHLELLTHATVSLARGRNIDTIIGSQTIDSFLPLKSELMLMSCGLYAAELINQFTPEHTKDEPLFRLFLETLRRISEAVNNEVVLRYFEMQLLCSAGYLPELHKCVSCHAPLEEVANYFSPNAGGILCARCRHTHPGCHISVDALKVMRFLQSNEYETACRLRPSKELSVELKSLIAGYILYILEREVKSAVWLDELRNSIGKINSSSDADQ